MSILEKYGAFLAENIKELELNGFLNKKCIFWRNMEPLKSITMNRLCKFSRRYQIIFIYFIVENQLSCENVKCAFKS